MSDTQARCTTRETAIRNQRTLLTQVHTLDIGGGVEHLLHARTTLGTFVRDDDAVATLHLATQDTLAGVLLRVEHHGRSFKVPEALVHASRLDHATILSDVAKENSQAAILCIGVLKVADTAIGTISIECTPLLRL